MFKCSKMLNYPFNQKLKKKKKNQLLSYILTAYYTHVVSLYSVTSLRWIKHYCLPQMDNRVWFTYCRCDVWANSQISPSRSTFSLLKTQWHKPNLRLT